MADNQSLHCDDEHPHLKRAHLIDSRVTGQDALVVDPSNVTGHELRKSLLKLARAQRRLQAIRQTSPRAPEQTLAIPGSLRELTTQ